MSISVTIELHKEIVDYVKKSSYNSVAEFVKVAVREKIKNDKSEKMMGKVKLFNKMVTGGSAPSDIDGKLDIIIGLLKK